jgi:dipeptidyl aminopeptidase/acylaminoacyl peptidase
MTLGPVIAEPYEGRGKDNFYLYCRQNGLWPQEVGGRNPEEDPAFFEQYCPVRNVSQDFPPTLLLHGNQDTDVPYQQSVLMTEAFSRHNVEFELITMDSQGHGFDGNMDHPLVKDAFIKVLAFLDMHTKEMKA